MREVVLRQRRRRLVRWGHRVFFACAALTLGYCGFVVADAWIFQHQESRGLDRQLHQESPTSAVRLQVKPSIFPRSFPAIATGGMIGLLEIPRLGLSVIVIEGDDKTTLRRAAG